MSDVKDNVNNEIPVAAGGMDGSDLVDFDVQDAGEAEPLLDGIELDEIDLFGENTGRNKVNDADNVEMDEISMSDVDVYDGEVPEIADVMDDVVDVSDISENNVVVDDVAMEDVAVDEVAMDDVAVDDVAIEMDDLPAEASEEIPFADDDIAVKSDEMPVDGVFETGVVPVLPDDSSEFEMGMDAQTPEVPEEPIFDDSAYGNGGNEVAESEEEMVDIDPVAFEVSPVSSELPAATPASSENPVMSPVSGESPLVSPVSGERPVVALESGNSPAVMVKSDVSAVRSDVSAATASNSENADPFRPKSGVAPIHANDSSPFHSKPGISPLGTAKQGLPPASAMRPAGGSMKFPPMPSARPAAVGPGSTKLPAPLPAMKSSSVVATAPAGQPVPFSPAAASSTASSATDTLLISQLRSQVDQLKAESANVAELREEVAELKVKLSDLTVLREENESLKQIEKAQKETIIRQMDDLEAARMEIERLKAELAITIETSTPPVASSAELEELSGRLKKSEFRVQQLEAENENMREAWYIKHKKLTTMKDTLVKLLQDKDAFFKEEVAEMRED